jgi:DNA polymerase-1
VLAAVSGAPALAVAIEVTATPEPAEEEEDDKDSDQESGLLPLTAEEAPDNAGNEAADKTRAAAISVAPGSALTIAADSPAMPTFTSVLAKGQIPKAIHDWKTAWHALEAASLTGVRHDPRLYSYLLDPTYSSHRLPEVALRHFNLKLGGSLAEAADITGRLATALRKEVDDASLTKLYEEVRRGDLEVPRMAEESSELGRQQAEEFLRGCGWDRLQCHARS